MGKKKRSSSGKSQDAKTNQGKSWLVMDQVKPPEPFDFQDSSSWPAWIKRYKMFHSAVGLSTTCEDQQISMLLYCMGPEAENLLTSLGLAEGNRTSYNCVVATFEDYFLLKKNEFYHRALFLERNQTLDENIDCYVNELSKLAEKCDWSCKNCKSNDFMSEMILVKLITGINDKSLSKQLQRKEIATLTEGVKLLKESEVVKKSSVADVPTSFTTMKIQSLNLSENNLGIGKKSLGNYQSTRESDSSAKSKVNVTCVGQQMTSIPSQKQKIAPKIHHPISKTSSQEEKGSMRSSFSLGVDTGDEYVVDEQSNSCYFYIPGRTSDRFHNAAASSEQKGSPASTSSFREDHSSQFIKQCGCRVVNCPHETTEFETEWSVAISRKRSMKLTDMFYSIGIDDLDSDEEDYLQSFNDFNQKNYLCNKTSSSVTSTFSLDDDDTWPELEETPKVENTPKSYDNFHFSVSGHQPRRLLRKMCQQTIKKAY